MRTQNFAFADLVGPAAKCPFHVGDQLRVMYEIARTIPNPTILELGTNRGASTTVFLQACEEAGGRLVSVDIQDCSSVSNSPLVTFVQSDSTDARHVVSQAPFLADGIDVLYVNSLHQRQHVEREVAAWFSHVKQGGWIFFDDVDASPHPEGATQGQSGGRVRYRFDPRLSDRVLQREPRHPSPVDPLRIKRFGCDAEAFCAWRSPAGTGTDCAAAVRPVAPVTHCAPWAADWGVTTPSLRLANDILFEWHVRVHPSGVATERRTVIRGVPIQSGPA